MFSLFGRRELPAAKWGNQRHLRCFWAFGAGGGGDDGARGPWAVSVAFFVEVQSQAPLNPELAEVQEHKQKPKSGTEGKHTAEHQQKNETTKPSI